MLDRAHRLRRRSEFTAAVRAGRRAGRATVVVHLRRPGDRPDQPPAPGGVDAPPRAGFIVSKAVGGAVVRNTVRRRLRELVRPHLAELPPGSLLVVRALPAAAGASSARLSADLVGALRSITRGRSGRAEPAR
ncbi:ribonuclease P protein component [Natronosporangium hydrolyticum]|uniref:Ribonuclease P protein component n=1 Tax=Natronosporangium hydrolyticum TaxID=2811111 RepID=A0A895YNP4_9ACTN|nr:ribonuclease P protein component [Natronosporangium hydrolyticum]QSB17582.1 ribonuclease P protein component [Natronosporangium hydrolyticum]